ncbi:MAG TPA: hypothetical protein VFG79_23435 [Solirubrobacter sp.]|nr:hypothetical protein [Solirubrobacter sp.]
MADAMLVGSANVESAQELFRLVAATSDGAIGRIPDGERGRRVNWLAAQGPFLSACDQLEAVDTGPNRYGSRGQVGKRFRPRAGVDLSALTLDLPYVEDALESFAAFRALADDGVVGDGVRMQICIPTAMATCLALIAPEAQRAMLAVMERTVGEQVRRIAAELPHDRIALQWDVAAEFMHIELAGAATFPRDEIAAALVRLAGLVPGDIGVGYHLCYGDAPPEPGAKGRHFVEPADAGLLVEIANAIVAGAGRPVEWIHLPVPINRSDEAYFAPLAGLRLPAQTRLFLGLVHEEDGLEGAQRRVAAASRFASGFGVATECGLQNEPRPAHDRILAIQRDLEVPTEVLS